MILEGRTNDAISKTKELFPTLLNDKNLLFLLKVRQFIEMVNGTESEICKTEPSSTSQSTTMNCSSPNNSLSANKNNSNSSCCSSKKNSSYSTTGRSLSPMTAIHTSTRSRSNSPYTSERVQHSNGTTNSSSHRTSVNNPNESSQGKSFECFFLFQIVSFHLETSCQTSESSNSHSATTNSNPVVNLMDVDDNVSSNNTANGFSNHGTVNQSPSTTNQISNGHTSIDNDNANQITDGIVNSNGCSGKSTDILDGMEHDGCIDSTHTMDMETTSSDVQKKSIGKDDDPLLMRILQFGRELHALKQHLIAEHGENSHNDKILQDAFSLLAYTDPKTSPLAHLLEPSQRETVSSAVNSAILGT